MIYAWIWVPQPFRCIIRKKWFPVESSSKPPLSEIPKPCKCVFQSRTASSFWTCSSVLFPIQERSPGRLNSVVMMRIVSDGSMSLSSDAIRRANIPNIWSSLSCVWLFLRKAKAESLIFLLETNADIYVKLIWFFNSLTVWGHHGLFSGRFPVHAQVHVLWSQWHSLNRVLYIHPWRGSQVKNLQWSNG